MVSNNWLVCGNWTHLKEHPPKFINKFTSTAAFAEPKNLLGRVAFVLKSTRHDSTSGHPCTPSAFEQVAP